MNTTVTLGSLKDAFGYGTDEALFPDADFLPLLNEALEQINYSGKYKGCIVRATFGSSIGYITLPFNFLSILGGNHGDCGFGFWGGSAATPVFAESHEFIESGPGHLDDTKHFRGILVDDQDGHATIVDIPPGFSGVLRIKLQNVADAGKTMRFACRDALGEPFYDASGLGFDFTTSYPSGDTTQVVSFVGGIQIPAMISPWSLYAVISGVETWLGTYYPPQRIACFRRYKTGVTDKPIRVLCQRRFLNLVHDLDYVTPGHVGGLKNAMKAVQKEDSTQESESLWQTAYQKFNEQVHTLRGGNRLEIEPANFGACNSFDNLMTLLLNLFLFLTIMSAGSNVFAARCPANNSHTDSMQDAIGKLCPQSHAVNEKIILTDDEAEKFWVKVKKEGNCWEWIGAKVKDGYGGFMLKRDGKWKLWRVNRLMWAITNGEIPRGIQVLHECDTPHCCNPKHLWLGTPLQNMRDKCEKGRQAKGETNGSHTMPWTVKRGDNHPWRTHPELMPRGERSGGAKLSEIQVKEIRSLYGNKTFTQVQLAEIYSMDQTTISSIVRRESWSHI